jgi:hypothetical protein
MNAISGFPESARQLHKKVVYDVSSSQAPGRRQGNQTHNKKRSIAQDVKRLVRRAEWLDQRVAQNPGRDLDYDVAESAAIKRVVDRFNENEAIVKGMQAAPTDPELDFWDDFFDDVVCSDLPTEDIVRKMYDAILQMSYKSR